MQQPSYDEFLDNEQDCSITGHWLPGSPQQTVVALHHYVVVNSPVALQAEAAKPPQLGLAMLVS